MSVEMKNEEILAAQAALMTLVEKDVPNLTALKLVRIARAVDAEAKSIRAVQQKIVERYTEKDEEGKPVPARDDAGKVMEGHIKLSDPKAFQAELDELLQGAATLEVEQLRAQELGKDFAISPRILLGLGPLLAEDVAT